MLHFGTIGDRFGTLWAPWATLAAAGRTRRVQNRILDDLGASNPVFLRIRVHVTFGIDSKFEIQALGALEIKLVYGKRCKKQFFAEVDAYMSSTSIFVFGGLGANFDCLCFGDSGPFRVSHEPSGLERPIRAPQRGREGSKSET